MNSSKALGFVKEQKSFVILVIVIIFAACASSMFFTIDNLQNLFLQISIQGIISFGMTFTLIAGAVSYTHLWKCPHSIARRQIRSTAAWERFKRAT